MVKGWRICTPSSLSKNVYTSAGIPTKDKLKCIFLLRSLQAHIVKSSKPLKNKTIVIAQWEENLVHYLEAPIFGLNSFILATEYST